MGLRYEYEEADDPASGLTSATLSSAPGDISTVWMCTLYDDDTGEELAEGLGNTQSEAKLEAQAKL